MPRHSAAAALETRRAVIRRAADMASVDGLAGVTVGRLATELSMSKAGVIGQFGSKEALQLAAVEDAVERFTAAVWRPAEHLPAGAQRLRGVLSSWVDYLGDPPFPGGCFLTAAAFEVDDQPGPVRDSVRDALRLWDLVLEHEIARGVADNELDADLDPTQTRYELVAAALAAVTAFRLDEEQDASALCRRAMAHALRWPREELGG